MSRSQRPSLAESMKRVARPEAVAPRPAPPDDGPRAEPPRAAGYYAATRAGKKKLTASVAPAAHTQFRQLSLELGKKGEPLLIEAINDLFTKYGKPPIA
jgi:antitoxin-like ribbon-helix-helix protein